MRTNFRDERRLPAPPEDWGKPSTSSPRAWRADASSSRVDPCGQPDNDTHFLAFRLSSGSTLRSFYRSSAAVTGLGSLFPRKLIRFVYHCQAVNLGVGRRPLKLVPIGWGPWAAHGGQV